MWYKIMKYTAVLSSKRKTHHVTVGGIEVEELVVTVELAMVGDGLVTCTVTRVSWFSQVKGEGSPFFIKHNTEIKPANRENSSNLCVFIEHVIKHSQCWWTVTEPLDFITG